MNDAPIYKAVFIFLLVVNLLAGVVLVFSKSEILTDAFKVLLLFESLILIFWYMPAFLYGWLVKKRVYVFSEGSI